jgi:ribosomal protein S18 acetylase RimI-like enzyme
VDIRRLGSGDDALLRDVRLRALEDAPYAFSSWHAREAALGDAFWTARVAESEIARTGAIFAALDGGRSVGMAGGFLPDDEHADAVLWGMWVDPSARRRGIGRELLDAVASWAREAGAQRLRLALAQDEASRPAAALYRTLGFAQTGESEPLESNPSSIALVMSRALQ